MVKQAKQFICSFNTAHKHRQHQPPPPPPPPTCGAQALALVQLQAFKCFKFQLVSGFLAGGFTVITWLAIVKPFAAWTQTKVVLGPPFPRLFRLAFFCLTPAAILVFKFPNLSSFSSSWICAILRELPQSFCERWVQRGRACACSRHLPHPYHPPVALVVGCISTQASLVG